MNNLRLLWQYMQGNRITYLGAILSVGLATFFALIGPLVIRITIDSVIGDQPLEVPEIIQLGIARFGGADQMAASLWIPGLVLVAITGLRGLFSFFKGKWAAQAAESVARTLRERLYDHLQRLPYDYHVKAETGDLVQRCTSDVDTIRKFFATQFVEVGNALFMVTIVAYIMASLDLRMTFLAMAVVPPIFLFAVVFHLKVRQAFQLADEAEGSMTATLQENLSGMRVVKAFARQEFEIAKFDKKNCIHRDLTYRLIKLLAYYWSSSDFLCMVQIALVLVVGAYWTAQGQLSLGTLVVFLTYEGMLLWPVRQMGRIITDMGKAQVAATRIQEILDQPCELISETGAQPPIRGAITFANVCLQYSEGQPVLRGVSFSVEPGSTIAILGPTGSGKSSLVHLLPRLYEYQQGSIRIDGHELKTIEKHWIRKNVGIVLQEPFLFAKTIKDNIKLGNADALDDQLYAVARTASIHDVILSFDKGYDTLVGERGVSLSGGQKQRVAIARALVKDCPILIFDDSLSAVDTETDAAIRHALRERTNKATTLIISHRVVSLMQADRILVIDKGMIVQSGTHAELVRQPGLYQRVWDIQNDLSEELLENMATNL